MAAGKMGLGPNKRARSPDKGDGQKNNSSSTSSDKEPAVKMKRCASEAQPDAAAMTNESCTNSSRRSLGSGRRHELAPNKKAKRVAQFGNYDRYYEYRVRDNRCRSGNREEIWKDNRLSILKREWFYGKRCLDVGCNAGYLTINIALKYRCSYMLGVDIDPSLVGKARKLLATKAHEQACLARTGNRHVCHAVVDGQKQRIPIALSLCEGDVYPSLARSASTVPNPINTVTASTSTVPSLSSSKRCGGAGVAFPRNCFFKCEDFVHSAHGNVKKYDLIMCMSVTKWVHLNWGDAGIKTLFQKCYDLLAPGGRFILEPQRWRSYKKKRNISETTRRNFHAITLKPKDFPNVLLNEIGFSSMKTLRTPAHVTHGAKGFRRSIHLYLK